MYMCKIYLIADKAIKQDDTFLQAQTAASPQTDILACLLSKNYYISYERKLMWLQQGT